MREKNEYKQINWTDGMKINKDHFIGLENYFTQCDAEIRRMNIDQYSYGLLPLTDKNDTNLEFELMTDDQNQLKVKLKICQAIDPQGYRIDISGESLESSFSLSQFQENSFYLAISADPYTRVAYGQADAGESQLRQPFVVPEYKLHLAPSTMNISSAFGNTIMPLGKIMIISNRPETDRNYIPPCMSVNSHPEMIKFFDSVDQNIIALERNIVELISEINLKTTSNALINIILHIAGSVLHHLNGKITEYRWFTATRPPIILISNIISLARTVRNAFETRIPEERERLLNYLSDHFDINPAKFKQLLDVTIGIDYQHNDIRESLVKAEDFITVFSQLINELKKMEFIVGEPRKKRIDIIIR